MFKFLKEKLKNAISKISKKVEEEIPEETLLEKASTEKEEVPIEEVEERKPKKKPKKKVKKEVEKLKPQEAKVEEKVELPKAEPGVEPFKKAFAEKKEVEEEELVFEEKPKEKKGFFARFKEKVVTKKISEEKFDELFWELEKVLLENNVAVEVIEKIKESLKVDLVNQPIARKKIFELIQKSLKENIEELFKDSDFDLLKEIEKKKPYVIIFVGINGSGKTTTIAKVAHMLKEKGLSVVLAAADTFRAASIEQLEEHGRRLDVKVIKHDYGSDPAAVAFDAIKHAETKDVDVVLVDTAGRMHSNVDLVREMEKIVRVAKPDLKVFVGEAITGNDCVEQAKVFNDAVGVDGIILAKLDVDEKGGAAISVSYVTDKPILYFGVGQEYKDLEKFNLDKIVKNLGL